MLSLRLKRLKHSEIAALTATFCLLARVNSFVSILEPLESWLLATLRPVSY